MAAENRRTHLRGQRIEETARRQWREKNWRPKTGRKGRMTARKGDRRKSKPVAERSRGVVEKRGKAEDGTRTGLEG